MEMIFIFNGLGNQMSQYALYLAKKENKSSVFYAYNSLSKFDHNGYELEKVFGISHQSYFKNTFANLIYRILFAKKLVFIMKPIQHLLSKLNVYAIIENSNYDFEETILENKKKSLVFYYGGWHSEKYFADIKSLVKEKFRFNLAKLNIDSTNMLNQIKNCNSISLHIRRGDYMSVNHYNTFGCVCTLDYYKKAISFFCSHIDNPVFFVFSNDMEWVKSHITGVKLVYVDFNTANNSWMDMCLMTQCRHNIISNSTFSWWGAWLNFNTEKKVIRPEYFVNKLITKDFYPESWIKI